VGSRQRGEERENLRVIGNGMCIAPPDPGERLVIGLDGHDR
jgi:hypothetical protein